MSNSLFAITEISSARERLILNDLFQRYYGMMLCHVMQIISNRAEAEDIVVEASMSLFDKANKLKAMNEYECAAYMVHTAVRRAYKHNKAAWRKKITSLNEEIMGMLPDQVHIAPEELILMREKTQEIAIALMQLSERDRLLIDFRYYQNLSCREIAKRMNITEGNVQKSLYDARRRALPLLKEVLDNG